jgi:DNA-binding transcriptional regulator YiaG
MTPDDFRSAQRALGLSDRELAEFLCVDVRNVRRWKRGENDIPRWVEKFLPVFVRMFDTGECSVDVLEMMGLP